MLKKEDRLHKIRHRKNFFLTLIVTIAFWLAAASFVYFSDPASPGILPLFFLIFFFALFFTSAVVLAHRRRGFLISLAVVLFFILKYLGVGNLINLVLLSGIFLIAEIYFSKK